MNLIFVYAAKAIALALILCIFGTVIKMIRKYKEKNLGNLFSDKIVSNLNTFEVAILRNLPKSKKERINQKLNTYKNGMLILENEKIKISFPEKETIKSEETTSISVIEKEIEVGEYTELRILDKILIIFCNILTHFVLFDFKETKKSH